MKKLNPLLFRFLFCTLCLLSSSTLAFEQVELSGDWSFKNGDSPQWHTATFDDSAWQKVVVPKLLFQDHGVPVKGWYRFHFDFVNPTSADLALLIETIRHADDTWLNGVRIGGLGQTYDAWDFYHTNPQSLPRLYKIPEDLLRASDNVLAIKTNVGFGEAWGAMFPGGAGITKGSVFIGEFTPLLQQVHKTELSIIAIDTIFAVLGIIDLLIISILIKTAFNPIPEFKWLLATSFFLLLGASAHDINYVYSIEFINTNFSMFTAMLVLPYTTAMYFWSQYRDLSKKLVTLMSIIWAFNVTVMLLPAMPFSLKNASWYVWNIQTVAFFLYSIFASIKGIVYKRIGAYAQFFGIVIYTFSIRSQWLPEDFFGHRNIQLGSIFYRYALLFAYFQQMLHLRTDFKKLSIRIVGIIEEVRHSIARELHDGLGQFLASAKLQANLAKSTINKEKHLDLVFLELNNGVQGLRRLINGLHPVIIDKTDIVNAISLQCSNIEKNHDVKITFKSNSIKISKECEVHVFRMFQECVLNAIKHGQAQEISVNLLTDKRRVTLCVADNGSGFDQQDEHIYSQEHGYGFVSLKERVVLLDGNIHWRSGLGKGSEVTINFPYSFKKT